MTGRQDILFQLNTRALLASIGANATLDDLTEQRLAALIPPECTLVWFLGAWTVGEASRAISRADPAIQADRRATLPDGSDRDIVGSCFSIAAYRVPDAIGGDPALARLRTRLAGAGHRLMLDFVPNHTAPDHPWVDAHPDRYVAGTDQDRARDPAGWARLPSGRILAHGRDPYFPAWTDVLQLDYANPETARAMTGQLVDIARRCDAIRADMAMLVLPDVFEHTWHRRAVPFWRDAIAAARAACPGLVMMAEAYWGMEPDLRACGFDLAYDKPFLDAALADDIPALRTGLAAQEAREGRTARFLENHDEPRAAATMDWPKRRAMTALLLASPGLKFLQAGQIEGARTRLSMHLGRAPAEPVDETSRTFHRTLLEALGDPTKSEPFAPLTPTEAWPGNQSDSGFVVLHRPGPSPLLLAVNARATRGQCRVHLPTPPSAPAIDLADHLSPERHRRDAAELARDGLFLDLPPWGVNLFNLTPADEPQAPDQTPDPTRPA